METFKELLKTITIIHALIMITIVNVFQIIIILYYFSYLFTSKYYQKWKELEKQMKEKN